MIRGITAGRVSHAEPQNQSTSGLYIDEMPVADNAFNPDLDLFDVNRIEVLKGPQGTLYGAGAMSGAIRVITNEVDLTASHGATSLSGASARDCCWAPTSRIAATGRCRALRGTLVSNCSRQTWSGSRSR
jgi:iron complex outermembrane receptor protein